MYEVDEAARIITETVDVDANIIFGATINEQYNGELKITVVATGFDEESNSSYTQETKVQLKSSPFGRKPVSERGISSQKKPVVAENDIDIPAFLRKKM
jgi:cell division protein FtsZ